jgi:hypothetical protein
MKIASRPIRCGIVACDLNQFLLCCFTMAWFQKTANSLDDVALHLVKQSQEKKSQESAAAEDAEASSSGVMVAPGVRFSERLWTRLGAQGREKEKQIRREKLTDAAVFPEIPPSLFDTNFKRDAIWKQRSVCKTSCLLIISELIHASGRELKLRTAYVEHLETLALQRDVEKEVLQEKLLEQVSGHSSCHSSFLHSTKSIYLICPNSVHLKCSPS